TLAERCDTCGALHHEDCWRDGGGCAVLGCRGGGTATVAAGAATAAGQARTWQELHERGLGGAAAQPAQWQPGPAAAPSQWQQGPAPPPPYQHGGGRTGVPMLLVAALVAAAGVLAGVLIATGVLNSSNTATTTAGNPAKAAGKKTQPRPHQLTGAQVSSDRRAIVGVLSTYQRAYSNHDLESLGRLFTPGVKRHGLAAGGCRVVEGKPAVLADYESQFNEGTGTYSLVGLQSNQISIDTPNRGHVHANYVISSGGRGFVNFNFAQLGGWKISQVYATCA
ncbi:MAG: nuclear transport factor 2 family protein, partial [Solirubrobacteraceae bacterium]